MKNWQVVTIPPEKGEDRTLSSLGISKKRLHELLDIAANAHGKDLDLAETLELITGECNNINEAVLAVFSYGVNVEHHKKHCGKCFSSEPEMPEALPRIIEKIAKELGATFGGVIEIKRNKDGDEE